MHKSNMAAIEATVSESLKYEASYEKTSSTSDYKKPLKNIKRRFRRKRSKVRYYKSLKRIRFNKNTEDLCSAVSVFDITDMDCAPSSSTRLPSIPTDVVEWQKQEQLAYWKSRAISLEFENRMLHQHLRNVYAKQIEDYANSDHKEILADSEEEASGKVVKNSVKETVVPNVPEVKKRAEEMNKIYGSKAARVMGMETAVQLNYDRHMDQSKPSHWPQLPVKL